MNTAKSISSTFSPKSDLVLAEMMKKNNLEGRSANLFLEKITMFFSRAEISEKEMISSIQKEIGVSQKVAGQIAAGIKNTLIPTLWNNLSQKEKEYFLHEKKSVVGEVGETEKIIPKKIPTTSDIKNNFNDEPPKKADGTDSYRESIE